MTSTGDMLWEANLYFNSHPREEDDASNFPRLIALSISTHILTKRMTEYLLMFLFFCIFQLTSSRRGWRSTAYAGVNSTLFQLTSSRRGWHWTSSGSELDIPFQLTSSRRGWHAHSPLLTVQGCHFNSHPHEEDDPASWIPRSSYRHFNSHPHEEDDFHSFVLSVIVILFQLTSSRRGWPCLVVRQVYGTIFQLTSSRRGWLNNQHHKQKLYLFQLTSSRRGWPFYITLSNTSNYFNSHPHEEDDSRNRNLQRTK